MNFAQIPDLRVSLEGVPIKIFMKLNYFSNFSGILRWHFSRQTTKF